MTNRGSAIKGVIWSAIEKFAVQGVQFIVAIVLSRILTPSDFGIVAIILVFTQIFQTLNESGFNTALIFKQNRDSLDFSTAFVANVTIGVISYIILFVLSPYIADFYQNEQLKTVMRVLTLIVIINSFELVPLVQFTVNIDFKSLAKASLLAAIFSGILGIVFACIMKSVYAIVLQTLTYSLINTVIMCYILKWKPCFRFSFKRFKAMFNYAHKLIGARLINVIFDDIYSLAIGKLYSPAVLGCYNRSMSFRQILSKNIINIIQRVSNPLLCEQQNDYRTMQSVLLRFISTSALIVYPLLAGLMVFSGPLVNVVLGPKWSMVSELLILGCPCGFFYLISTFNRNVYNATGRTGLALKAEILKKIIFVLIFLLTMKFDIKILLTGLIIISILEMIIDVSFAKKQIGITLPQELKSIYGIILATIFMSLLVIPILNIHTSDILKLIIGTGLGILIYVSICYYFNICDLKTIINKKIHGN